MARTTGPLFSEKASGTVAGLITHGTWKGRTYARKKPTAGNPNSPDQVSVRAMMAWLSAQWSTFPIDAATRATWEDLALDANTTPFNAYLTYNLAQWSHQLPPSQINPRAPTDVQATVTPIGIAVAANPKYLDYTWTTNALGDGWGYIIYRQPNADFTPTTHNMIAIVETAPVGLHHFLDGPLTPGVWHYRFRRLTKHGRTPAGSTHEFQTVP